MKKHLLALLFPLLLLLTPVLAHAQAGGPARGDDGWEPVSGQMMQPGESFEAKNLVAAAYGFIWLMVAGFVFTVWRRTQAVEGELAELSKRVEQAAAHQAQAE